MAQVNFKNPTKEERVLRHKRFLEASKGLMPQRTMRFDDEARKTHYSQLDFEEGEEVMKVIDEQHLTKKELEELERQRAEMARARLQYEKDLLAPLKPPKPTEDRIKELQDKLTELRKDNDLRKLETDAEGAARMDVKAIREKFAAAWPEFQRKQVEMEMATQEMHKRYVEMHLIYKKYLIDED